MSIGNNQIELISMSYKSYVKVQKAKYHLYCKLSNVTFTNKKQWKRNWQESGEKRTIQRNYKLPICDRWPNCGTLISGTLISGYPSPQTIWLRCWAPLHALNLDVLLWKSLFNPVTCFYTEVIKGRTSKHTASAKVNMSNYWWRCFKPKGTWPKCNLPLPSCHLFQTGCQ